MPKAQKVDLQIRGVPAAVRDRLRKRARSKGVSMSRYVIDLLQGDIDRPTINEWLEEVRKDPPLRGNFSSAELIRDVRRELWGDED